MSMKLIRAAANNKIALVRECLRRGDDVDDQENLFGQTALHCALKSKHYEVANLLSRFGADPRIADDKGFTALDIYYGVYERHLDKIFMQRIEDSAATGLTGDSYLNDDYSADIY